MKNQRMILAAALALAGFAVVRTIKASQPAPAPVRPVRSFGTAGSVPVDPFSTVIVDPITGRRTDVGGFDGVNWLRLVEGGTP